MGLAKLKYSGFNIMINSGFNMYKLLSCFSLITSLSVSLVLGKPIFKKPTKLDIIKAEIEQEVQAGQIEDLLRKCNAKIKEGRKSGTPIAINKYSYYISKLNYWHKYRWFIADTKLSKKWLTKVRDLLVYMKKTQDFIETSKYNNTTKDPKFDQAVKYLDVAYERFVKLIEKPAKVSGKVQRKAKLNKVIWQKAMRKKYKIKDKPNMADF